MVLNYTVKASHILHGNSKERYFTLFIASFACCPLKLFSNYFIKVSASFVHSKRSSSPTCFSWVNALNRFLKALVHEHVKVTPSLPSPVYLPSPKSVLWDWRWGNNRGLEPVRYCCVQSAHVKLLCLSRWNIKERCQQTVQSSPFHVTNVFILLPN